MTAKKIRILYIAGYGHSGSTILEMLLSCPKGVIGFGELSDIGKKDTKKIDDNIQKKVLCEPYYHRIKQKLEDINESWESTIDIVHCEHLFSKKKPQEKSRYRRYWSAFFYAAAEAGEYTEATFVDSSKSAVSRALRPILLKEIKNLEVTCVHLFRNPSPILTKMRKKEKRNGWINGEFIPVAISAYHWLFSNLWPIYAARYCDNYVRLSYEKLCDDPTTTLSNLGSRIGLDMSDPIHKIKQNKPLPRTCALAGNRLLFQKETRFQPVKKKPLNAETTLEKFFATLLYPMYKLLCFNSL